MPGLAGLITRLPEERARERVACMLGTMLHESFYNSGLYAEGTAGVYVGWTCHTGSFADCMPIFNEQKDVVLFLAGEVFTDLDEILRLRRQGHDFADGDATHLVHMYEELGDKFFAALNGQFSGLLIDKRTQRTFLFNDRYGMHRLFVHRHEDAFYFASEAKALLAVLPQTREFDPKGLAELLTCGCTLGEHSLFKDIEVLPGGSLLEYSGRLLRQARYFSEKDWEDQPRLSEKEFFARFLESFPETVRRYALSPLPVGLSLTGGLDSRMVLAALNPPPASLPCYTFGSMYRETYDVKISRKVAGLCRQVHHSIVVGEEFLNGLPQYLERAVTLSDGYIGLSGAAELYANGLARRIAPVRITGNYGSELLRKVRAFKWALPRGNILNKDFQPVAQAVQPAFEEAITKDPISFVAFHQAPQQGFGRWAIENSQILPRSPFLDAGLVALLYQAPPEMNGRSLSEGLIRSWLPVLLTVPSDRGFLGPRESKAAAIRQAYRQFLFKGEYAVSHGAPDWYVRLGSTLRLNFPERLLLGRHKFYHLRTWIREALSDFAREVVSDSESRSLAAPYLNVRAAEQAILDHLQGRKNYIREVDCILSLLLTAKHSLRRSPAAVLPHSLSNAGRA